MTPDFEIGLIGGGAVGLAIAAALARAGREVIVLERNGRLGSEVSSRSSEVVHAGLYYPPGSLKARLCVEGRHKLYRFAAENGIGIRKTGKLLVATSEDELAKLDAIAASAAENGAGKLEFLSGQEARRLEPELFCAAALLSPETGIFDSHGLVTALEGHVTAAGGTIVLNTRASGLRSAHGLFEIETCSASQHGEEPAGTLRVRRLVLAGGLGASELGRMLSYRDGYAVPDTTFAKGHYFSLDAKAPFSRLVYPMPHGGGLGIHLTLDLAGRARFGPDIEWTRAIDYSFQDENRTRQTRFEAAIRRYWPGLPDGALAPGSTGIRPKISAEGEPAADFAIHGPSEHGIDGLVALYGIESPGLTSSLAIGDLVAGMVAA